MAEPAHAGADGELPVGYRLTRVGDARLGTLPGLEPWATAAIREHGSLFAAAAVHSDAERLAGRGVTLAVPAPGGSVVVRRYRRGGAVARLVPDRYLRYGVLRPWREMAASVELRHRGVPTPEVLAGVVYPAGIFYRAELVTRRIEPAIDLAELLFSGAHDGATRAAACRAAGGLLRRLHEAGVAHPDLNAKNILLRRDRPAEAYVLDLDRVRLTHRALPGAARRRMRARLERSLAKWERRSGRALAAGERIALDAGYDGEIVWDERRDVERG